MDILPPELVVKILSFLDSKTITICRQVCMRWRILSTKLTNPLYLSSVMGQIMKNLQKGKLRDLLKLRLVCKFWKDGLDRLTQSQAIYIKGVTNLDSRSVNSLHHSQWNPFPSRIIRLKLCHGHDDPEVSTNPPENLEQNLFMETFGKHTDYLQVSLEHAVCAEEHLVKLLNYVANVKGLVISETPSPFRFVKKDESPSKEPFHFDLLLKDLQFLKLDDSDSKLKYTELYKTLIKSAPNLEHLEINGYQHLDMGIVRLLSDRQPAKLNLTKLKIDAEDPDLLETLEILNKAEFPLTYLSLKVNGFGDKAMCHTCTEILHGFLKGIGQTLERLELKLSWYDKDMEQAGSEDFPELLSTFPSSKFLNKLKRFKVVGYRGHLGFVGNFFSLKYLMIVRQNSEEQHNKDRESLLSNIPTLDEVHVLSQQMFQAEKVEFKKRLSNFMYEGDASFVPKYCGLYQEGFP